MDAITFLTACAFFCFMNFQLVSSGLITNSRKTALQDQNDEKEFGLNSTDARKIYEDKYDFCGTSDDTAEYQQEEKLLNYDDGSDNIRVKRAHSSGKRKVIQVAIFVDNAFYEHVKSTTSAEAFTETERRVRSIMNQVESIYNYSSLQMKFRFAIAKFVIYTTRQGGPNPGNGDVNKYLENFCHWQNTWSSRAQWDHSILLTGRDLHSYHNGQITRNTAGLAYVGTMCSREWSCSLTKGTNFGAAFIAAHEIAHSLGVGHDGANNNCDSQKFIMGGSTRSQELRWSSCTNAYLNNFFTSGNGRCIHDDVSPPRKLTTANLPGMTYSLTDQCAIAFGHGSTPSKHVEKNVCKALWCTSGSLLKTTHPALEGSSCDNGKICIEGHCLSYRHG